MEIQKIFSDMYDEERLYSVLLDEEEMALYSEIMRMYADDEKKKMSTGKKAAIATAGTLATAGAGFELARRGRLGAKTGIKLNEYLQKSNIRGIRRAGIRQENKIMERLAKSDSIKDKELLSTIRSGQVDKIKKAKAAAEAASQEARNTGENVYKNAAKTPKKSNQEIKREKAIKKAESQMSPEARAEMEVMRERMNRYSRVGY